MWLGCISSLPPLFFEVAISDDSSSIAARNPESLLSMPEAQRGAPILRLSDAVTQACRLPLQQLRALLFAFDAALPTPSLFGPC